MEDANVTPQDTQQARERLAALERRDQLVSQIAEAEQKVASLKEEFSNVQGSIDTGSSRTSNARNTSATE